MGVILGVWAALGRLLAPGRSRTPSGVAPGRLWGAPGVPLGAQDGTQVGLKLALKSVQEAPKMDPKARPLSEGRWNAKMEPKWDQETQNEAKLGAKWTQNTPKLGAQRHEKSIWLVKRKIQLNASRLAFSWVSRVEVGR